jgi:phosphoserine phosphatase
MSEIILVNLMGSDRPGITRDLSGILAQHGARILDIGQSVIHDTLTLGMLIELPPVSESHPVLKDMLFKAHEWGLQVRFTPISNAEYESWVDAQGKPRYILTLLGPQLSARHMEGLGGVATLHGMNIDRITRLSGRVSLFREPERPMACVEFSVRGAPDDPKTLRADLLDLSQRLEVDIAIQVDDVFRRNRRMVAFDMDSTLIQIEVINELAAAAGVGDQVAAITREAMNGKIEFKEALRRRLRPLKGLPTSVLDDIIAQLPITDGAERLIHTLKTLGYKTAILSGGFTYVGDYLQKRFGIDHVYANTLASKDGVLTGEVEGPIVDGQRKAELLREIAQKEGIRIEQVIAVGDGANDLPMLSAAGLGIAFHAKPTVKASAEQALSTLGLDAILYLIGMSDREVAQA